MCRKILNTRRAPKAVGPYSQAIRSRGLIFTSGQIPLDPKTGKLLNENFKKKVQQVLCNIGAILESDGSKITSMIKCTVFLTDLPKFSVVNEVFDEVFDGVDLPARSVVEVSKLPLDADIEIECISQSGN